ncbi:PREDICTED: phosphatidylinositol transfer protein alpha isoform-like [Priapulus caudatus]|uniref:Phosphatidylinositol transfer protein alpha isoform-like n=1 Tax=Priapulus caudatus TaxID=37621 RepID=A0ABM1EW33_PRICU|nr:PREDICTED: phosphatidylinositol transfer protein alpha isoform-like [Priapulus caudatus]
MLIKEYRIVLPFSVEEYRLAQLWSTAKASKRETGGGEGIEVVVNEPFSSHGVTSNGMCAEGQYTHKIYHLYKKLPLFLRMIMPKRASEIHEKAWNAYPYCKTVVSVTSNGGWRPIGVGNTEPRFMKEGCTWCSNRYTVPTPARRTNVHMLSKAELQQREVIFIDIANDHVMRGDCRADEDPSAFTSLKTGRGPLGTDWQSIASPIMCCYKLVRVEFKWWGVQDRVEQWVQQSEGRLFLNFHRQMFCWIDLWYGLTSEEVRKYEDRTILQLDEVCTMQR